jgi:hypothetical protein
MSHGSAPAVKATPRTVIEYVLGRLKAIGISEVFGVPGDYALACSSFARRLIGLRCRWWWRYTQRHSGRTPVKAANGLRYTVRARTECLRCLNQGTFNNLRSLARACDDAMSFLQEREFTHSNEM